jgi:rubrerythrin
MEKFIELIDFAISEERKFYELYSRTAERVEDKGASEMLKSMANMEKGHEAKLKAFKEGKVENFETDKVQDLKIGDYLVDVEINEESSVQDVLIYAVKSEKKANDLYTDLSTVVGDPDKKEFLLALADEEMKHKNDLEKYYDDNINKEN